MKRILLLLLIAVFLQTILFAQSPPKREVRAVWLTTAWALDWPSGTNRTPSVQQAQLLTILDRLEEANFNTIYFQVRPMCDAFYNSAFEPWSQWLTGARTNNDPGWSPLGFLIEHAHARGIEVHAWLNPYRYNTDPNWYWSRNLPNEIENTHPEWLLDYGIRTDSEGRQTRPVILNPGIPEVRQRIADIVEDIITKYNVDGIVFDDYFYVSGTTPAMDQAQFDAYPNGFPDTPAGRADWRRNNVNMMIRDVQARINSISPWIQWGISPAGVAIGNNQAVADIYGVRPSLGFDWQRNDLSSSPVAWLRDGTIDYISPQIYWHRNHQTNPYQPIAAWWAEVSNQFGRHFFSSHTKSMAGVDADNMAGEIAAQAQINRDEDINGAPGMVLFRANQSVSQAVYDALKNGPFQLPAITAMYGWKPAPMQGLVTNIAVLGQNVTWNYTPNGDFDVRYVIYAVPKANRTDADVFTSPRFLQGVSYTTDFTLRDGISESTHEIAVAVFDRFGNLFPPRVLNEMETTIPQVKLIYPANNQIDVIMPSMFKWEENGAERYIWQIAEDREFTQLIASRETTTPNFNLGLQPNIREGVTYYWRVKSIKANAPISISDVYDFISKRFQILTPAAGETGVSLTPEITWTSIGVEGATYTFELSRHANFSSILYTTSIDTNTVSIPDNLLMIATVYHARVRTVFEGRAVSSPHISFTTKDDHVPIPVLTSPTDGEIIYGEITVSWVEQVSRGFRVEMSAASHFPTMGVGTMLRQVDFNLFGLTIGEPEHGTYYIRVRATGQTAPSETVRFHVGTPTSVPEIDASKFFSYIYRVSDGISNLVINQTENNSVIVEVFSVTGNLLDRQVHGLSAGTHTLMLDMINYAQGIYLVRVNAGNNTKTLRVHR